MANRQSIVILLVEDDEGHRVLIRESLRAGGIINDVVECGDGRQALDYLARRGEYQDPQKSPRPGLILLDMKIPGIDGKGVLKAIKQDPQLQRIPVLMMTSADDQRDINACYDMGASGYIVKPIREGEFQQRLKALGMFLEIVSLPE